MDGKLKYSALQLGEPVMTDNYTSRPIKVVTLPIPEDYPFKYGPTTVLKFSHGKHVDIGCIVFLKMKSVGEGANPLQFFNGLCHFVIL